MKVKIGFTVLALLGVVNAAGGGGLPAVNPPGG